MEFFHHKTKYPFMATRRRWYLVSTVLIVAALTSFAFRGLNLGIDFTGGVVLELEFAQDANLEQRRERTIPARLEEGDSADGKPRARSIFVHRGELKPEVVGREAHDHQSAVLVLAIHRLEAFVLMRVAAVARRVDDEQHLALELT